VDFKNTILIMTSNLGAEIIRNQQSLGFQSTSTDQSYEKMKEMLVKEVERAFRPEFLNRVDDVIVFKQLTRADMKDVIEIELKGVKERLEDRKIHLDLTADAKEFLIDQGFNPDYGARPIKRAIERFVEDPLSEAVLRGEFQDKNRIHVRLKEGHLYFDAEGGPPEETSETVPMTETAE
jgi:ATP-dependent Clp protease ATP-binding subunit ClpC